MSIHTPTPKWLSYRVGAESDVSVRVAIGDAQLGGWAIGFGTDNVQKGSEADPVPVGVGKDIKGRILQIIATAVDVRPETNRLSATVTVSGGPDGDIKLPHSFADGGNGDSAIFTTLVGFE